MSSILLASQPTCHGLSASKYAIWERVNVANLLKMSPEVIQYYLATAQQGMQSLLAYDQRTVGGQWQPI